MEHKYAHISTPEQLRELPANELREFAEELRRELIAVVTQVGGHLAPSLGVIELTIALHRVFHTPQDQLIWDVGHQAYVHKMLTGRRDQLSTIRRLGGLSGFLKRNESEHDSFGAGHASTSISAALGMAAARDLAGGEGRSVAIIGDGAMTGGLAFEALNNAGSSGRDLLVILNDNKMSISPNVGAISRYLVNIITDPRYQKARDEIWDFTGKLPKRDAVRHLARRLEEGVKSIVAPGLLFEDLGFKYIGPVDGHNLELLLEILPRVRKMRGPVLLHVVTVKGKGWKDAEDDPVKYHGVKEGTPAPYKVPPSYAMPLAPHHGDESEAIELPTPKSAYPQYTELFGKFMIEIATRKPEVVAITAAMSEGTGLAQFASKLPDRFFDVGIAEAHGVCFAAGMAAQGYRPVCAIYSTFLQRAYDQIVHDVVLQHLPVTFVLDRAGLVGEDGPTHHGTLDLSYLACIPEMVVACPKDGDELYDLLITSLENKFPFAIRYPKEPAPAYDAQRKGSALPIGSWETLIEGGKTVVLATGSMVFRAKLAIEKLREEEFDIGLVNARFVKPVDRAMLDELSRSTKRIITIEENVPVGGLVSQVRNALFELGSSTPVIAITLPDNYIEHGKREELLTIAGLSTDRLYERLKELCRAE